MAHRLFSKRFIPVGLFSVLIPFIMAGCFKSSDDSQPAQTETPAASQQTTGVTLSGAVQFGPVSNVTINIYRINEATGDTDTFLGGGLTRSDGSFLFILKKDITAKSLRLRMSGGSFVDEATGHTIDVDREFIADFNLQGVTGELQVTPLSLMIHSLAREILASGLTGTVPSMSAAIDTASRMIGQKFGVADIMGTKPLMSDDPSTDTRLGARYGYVIGGFSHLAKGLSVHPLDLQSALEADISDGLINGKSGNTQVQIGATGPALPDNATTGLLSTAVRRFMDSLKSASSSSFAVNSAADVVLSALTPSIPPDHAGATPPTTGTLSPVFTVIPTLTPGHLVLSLRGLIDPLSRNPIDYSAPGAVVVSQDGTVIKGVKITPAAFTSTANADIVFVIDTTGSMSGTIDGVKASIANFIRDIRTKLVDVRVGVIAYADDIDPAMNPAGIASTDPAAYTVAGVADLSTDLTDSGAIMTFVNGLDACYLSYCGGDGPEGALDSLAWAHDNLSFKPGGQKVFILMTDITSWGKDAAPSSTTEISPSSPWTDASLAAYLSARGAVVHVVSNNTPAHSAGEYNVTYLAVPGGPNSSPGTGGTWSALSAGSVDLTALPISASIAYTTLIELKNPGAPPADHVITVSVFGTPPDSGASSQPVHY